MDTPASKLPEDSPDTGAPPVRQVPGDSAFACVSVTEDVITYNVDGLDAGPWIRLSEWDLFPRGDPAQPIPADDEQVWDWTDCPEFGKS